MNRKSLGRGLNSLIPEKTTDNEDASFIKVEKISLDNIKAREDQPRKNFDQDSLQGLAQSIQEYGLLNPIVVKKNDDHYEIIAGERRYRASKILGLEKIDAIVKDVEKKELDLLSVVENIQREDLTALEEAQAYSDIIENYGLTQVELAKTVGKSRSYIANTLRLLKLDDKSKNELENGSISSSQARTLLSIDNENERNKTLDDFLNKKTNIREVEKKVKKNKKKTSPDENLDRILFEDFEEKFMDTLGSKVNIQKTKNTYKVSIDCYSIDDIEKLYWRLINEND